MLRGAQRLASSLLVQLDTACSSGSGWEALQRAGISGTAAAARRLYPPTEPARPKDKEVDSGVERPYLVDKFLSAELLCRTDRNKLARQEVVRQYERFPGDTGSTEVQVALLTRKIEELAQHMRQHRKDYSSRRHVASLWGLEAMLHQRRKLLQYLRRTSFDQYAVLISRIGLKDSYGPQDRFSSRYKGVLKGRPAASSTAAKPAA
ncbi:hypothetical protein COHA_000233 [Chlorella ohadii]|uniref:Small ribosomal subunit protein uS15c n=1 Tax=Chlorella ohadii TaxID=2649997 RepID=A0AAD5E0R9_9CHLO|nr:hypothetical protein COHA_000233 [Chlorella ohadii]